jgi:hypothetical protein
MLLTLLQTTDPPFQYFLGYVHAVGWPALFIFGLTLAWRVHGLVSDAKERLAKFDELHKYATNHVPHDLADIKGALTSIDSGIKTTNDHWMNWLTIRAAQKD